MVLAIGQQHQIHSRTRQPVAVTTCVQDWLAAVAATYGRLHALVLAERIEIERTREDLDGVPVKLAGAEILDRAEIARQAGEAMEAETARVQLERMLKRKTLPQPGRRRRRKQRRKRRDA